MTEQTHDVTIVGAGMAGMTAALHLLKAGFTVKVVEASEAVGGKFGARRAQNSYHDFAWHVFADWCLNFWSIADEIGLRKDRDFVPQPKLTLLRPLERGRLPSRWPRAASISYVGSPEFVWQNLNSGVAHWSDLYLFAYSYYSLLCDQSLEHEEFLNRVPVNGYVRSLPFSSDIAALLHNELLLRIWAIPSYLISVRSYQTYLQLITPFTYPSPPVFVLKKNVEEGFWAPFRNTLNRYPGFTLETRTSLTGIRLNAQGDRVDEIVLRSDRDHTTHTERVRHLIVAIPPERFVQVLAAPDSAALRDQAPELLCLAKLPSQQTSSLTLFLKRRIEIPGVGEEPVSLITDFESMYDDDTLAQRSGIGSEYGLSLLEVGRMWGADHPTVYSVLASDADALGPLDDQEACRRVLRELQRYIPFTADDVDWDYTYFQPHTEARLFVNEVGSWENRPEVRLANSSGNALRHQAWRRIHNLSLAGDYCRSQIDIVSLEGAAHTGIWAAHTVSGLARATGRPGVRMVAPPRPPKDWDRQRAELIKGALTPWAPFAQQRSRAVAADIKAVARRSSREPGHGWTRTLTRAGFTQPHNEGDAAMSDAPSTFPGLAGPIPVARDKNRWFVQKYQEYRDRVTLKSGAVVPIPMFYWAAQALVLNGSADADGVDGQLLPSGVHAVRRPDDGRALVTIWAPDYGGTTVGPIKVVFGSIQVAARRTCPPNHQALPHFWWWWYYGNSIVNQQFKREVWGILNNDLSIVETLYQGETKTARVLEKGQVAIRLKLAPREAVRWQIVSSEMKNEFYDDESEVDAELVRLSEALVRDPRHGAAPFSFVTVSGRTNDDGENEVELLGAKFENYRFEEGQDECFLRDGTAVQKLLSSVNFTPESWDFYSSYNGVVGLYDQKGGAKPKGPRESPAEQIVADLQKLMRDLGR